MTQTATVSMTTELGLAFGLRAVACATEAQARLQGYRWSGVPPSESFVRSREDTLLISNLLVARWLITGEGMSDDEARWLQLRGTLAAAEGLSIANVTRSYLCWRDVACKALEEEAARLGTPAAVLKVALTSVRDSADAAVMRMARAFDEETGRLRSSLAAERETFRHQSLHDALTGLPNRVLLYDRLQQAVNAAHREGQKVVLLLLDLDRFKAVNDQHGHDAGDDALRAVAQALAAAVRGSDTVARLGGDEFALVLPGCASSDAGLQAARKVVALLSRPLGCGSAEYSLGVSVGVAYYPDHGAEPEELITAADRAMYRAKRGAASDHELAGHIAVAG